MKYLIVLLVYVLSALVSAAEASPPYSGHERCTHGRMDVHPCVDISHALLGAGVAGTTYYFTRSEKAALAATLVYAIGWEVVDSKTRGKKVYARDMFYRAAGGGIMITIIKVEW